MISLYARESSLQESDHDQWFINSYYFEATGHWSSLTLRFSFGFKWILRRLFCQVYWNQLSLWSLSYMLLDLSRIRNAWNFPMKFMQNDLDNRKNEIPSPDQEHNPSSSTLKLNLLFVYTARFYLMLCWGWIIKIRGHTQNVTFVMVWAAKHPIVATISVTSDFSLWYRW